jgi:histidinol phosphatase-like enzyme
MITQLRCDITKTFFVDDSATNVTAAQKYGIASILHKNWQQTEQELLHKGLQINDNTHLSKDYHIIKEHGE